LGKAECTEEGHGRTLHEEKPVRTSNEDESLRDNGNLQVYNGVEFAVIVVGSSRGSTITEGSTERAEEPIGLDRNSNQGDTDISNVRKNIE
jgi:hypothetical protein